MKERGIYIANDKQSAVGLALFNNATIHEPEGMVKNTVNSLLPLEVYMDLR